MGSLAPLIEPADDLDGEALERASRTLSLPGMGVAGQLRIAAARILVLGAGGLGSPVLQYLAAAGVGVLGVVDFDRVDLSNLQRQVIHRSGSLGELKTASAARTIGEVNPQVRVVQHPFRLDAANALALFADYDLVVDGTDNFATRYLANDAAALLGKPYVWGSVLRFDGQVTVFWESAPDARGVDYRDLHPIPPEPDSVLSCAEAGVLGSVCGTIGTMMATEAVKLVTGLGEPLLGRLQVFDALAGTWDELRIVRSPDRVPVTELIDYDEFCGVARVDAALEIDAMELELRIPVTLIDVREPWEHDAGHITGDRLVPLGLLLDDPAGVVAPGRSDVVVYCASGARSARAAIALREVGVPARSLRGGYQAWRLTHPT